jgi:hypothetical protein
VTVIVILADCVTANLKAEILMHGVPGNF